MLEPMTTFAIAGVSGNTGKVAAEALLARGGGANVRVIVRDASKGAAWKERGAEVAVADLSDAVALTKALQGVDGAYLLVPPAPHGSTIGYREHQDRVSRAIAKAVADSKLPHVVFLSSVGAQHESGTGPIAGLHITEQLLRDVKSTVVTNIRAGYFYENLAGGFGAAKASGALPSLFPADLRFPMTSTRDIGRLAADALLEPPTKSQVLELGTLRSHADVATALSAALAGKPITVQEVPPENAAAVFESVGFTKDLAALYAEMVRGLLNGRVAFEGTPHKHVSSAEPLDRVVNALL